MVKDPLLRIFEYKQAGETVLLATLVETTGAVPQAVGAQLIVRGADGESEFTIGGGALEEQVKRDGCAILRGEMTSQLVSYDLAELGMYCGGKAKVFFEVICPLPRLLIFGAGHVGKKLAALASLTDLFHIVLIDDRESAIADKEICDEVYYCPHYSDIPSFSHTSYVVIVTSSHQTDKRVLKSVLQEEELPFYIGMIGSIAKAAEIFRELECEGVTQQRLASVRSPIGLPIGGKSPGEVAMSILAELIATKNRTELVLSNSKNSEREKIQRSDQ